MPIKVSCPSCPTTLNVKDELAGKSVKCPKCQTITKVHGGQKTAAPASKSTSAGKSTPASNGSRAPTGSMSKGRKPPPPPEPEELEEVDELDDEEDDRKSKKKKNKNVDFEMPEKYEDQIHQELSKGEKVIWAGQPARRVVVVRALGFTIVGFIFFCVAAGLAVTAMVGTRGPHGGGFLIGGLAFLPISIGLMLTPLYKLWMAGRTCYVLTNRRCVVWRCTWYGSVDMANYNPAQLLNMRRNDMWFFGKGAGDLVFRSVTTITVTTGRNGGVSSSTTYYGFLSIENVRDIERLVRETLTDRLSDRLVE